MTFSPLIGITLETKTAVFAESHSIPIASLHQSFITTTAQAGGIPFGIPSLDPKTLPVLLEKTNGIILYRNMMDPTSKRASDLVHSFEFRLLQAAWEKNIPVLAIAGGAHYMASFLKGQLQNSFEKPSQDPHMQINPPHQGSHTVRIQPYSLLYTLTEQTSWIVNSFHQQKIQSTGQGIPGAIAEDGTIEAIEDPSRFFFLGVQWYPQFTVDYTDRKLFSALIAKARTHAQT